MLLFSMHSFITEIGYAVIPICLAFRSATCFESSGKVCVRIISREGANSISCT